MKVVFSLALFSLFTFSAGAQNPIEFRIYHKLGADTYAWNTPVVSGNGETFKVTRLQYYVSRFTLIHDGGQIMAISDDTIALIKASSDHTAIQLGSLPITSIEAIKFHIGVFSPVNNEDPAQYPSEHPLAPQIPSMHWGWASGYRFLAYEGLAGSNFTQAFELHALGNENYHEQSVALSGQDVDGTTVIAVDANYIEGLRNIPLSNGVIAHGENLEDKVAIENFRDYVFSARTDALNLGVEEELSQYFSIYPNPANSSGIVFIHSVGRAIDRIEVYDSQARKQEIIHEGDKIIPLNSLRPGIYIVRIYSNDTELCKRLVIN